MTNSTAGVVGRVVLVTGAGRGIGRAVADRLIDEGAHVIAHARTPGDHLDALAARGADLITCDLLADDGVDQLLSRVVATGHRVDGLVNNAAILVRGTATSTTDDDWHRTIHLGLTVPFRLARALVPGMIAAGRGGIVNVSSIAATTGGVMGPAYAAAKSGLLGLTRSLARELGGQGVRVNTVIPSLTDTGMIDAPELAPIIERQVAMNPLGRIARPDEVAAVVIFLLSDDASYVNGHDLKVTGGP